jgi:hypothetical protein
MQTQGSTYPIGSFGSVRRPTGCSGVGADIWNQLHSFTSIRVLNNERALFTVNNQKFVGVIQRLSTTGGSALLSKGPIPQGTAADMGSNTVFGKVTAQIQFLHSGTGIGSVVDHGITTWICFEWRLSLFLELTAVAT